MSKESRANGRKDSENAGGMAPNESEPTAKRCGLSDSRPRSWAIKDVG